MKKLIAIAIAVTMAVVAVPAGASDDLQSQIDALLAQIATLQAQLAGTTVPAPSTPAVCSGVSFTRNLSVGTVGNDVKCLQALLNTDSSTQVAVSGVGSTGMETTYFGSLTRTAVISFQNKYASEVLTPLGLTAGTGFVGASTRAKLNTMLTTTPTPPTDPTTPPVSTPGVEGSITAKHAPTPITAQDVFANSTGNTIVGLEVKALNSDVVVNRLDIKFTSRPWLYVSKISVADGTTIAKTMDVTSSNTIETTVGTNYTVRIEGLNILVPKDTTKVLNVQIDAILPAGVSTATVTYEIIAAAVRGTDGAGLSQTAPTVTLGSRTVIIKTSDVAVLEVSAHVDNPIVARNVKVSETVTTENVLLAMVNVKSKTNASVIRTVKASSTAPADSVVKLYDGSTLLGSVTQAATVEFTSLNIPIAKDATKVLTIKADIPKEKGTGLEASASLQASSATIVAEDATTFASVNVTGSTVSGSVVHLRYVVPVLALNSATFTPVKPPNTASNTQWADFKIRVNVTADGGDIYVADNASSGLVATTSVPASATMTATALDSNATEQTGGEWLVTNGATRYFEISGRIENTKAEAYYVRALLSNIKWGTTANGATTVTQDWGLDNLRTDQGLLEAKN